MLYIIIARATPWLRLSIAGVVAALSIACLPRRLWASQLRRLGFICALIAAFTALGADGVPPVLQPHSLPASLEGVHATLQPGTPYSYVVFNLFGWVTITRRSFNLAITAAALTFCALQSASLCLVTTPGEEMALGLSRCAARARVARLRAVCRRRVASGASGVHAVSRGAARCLRLAAHAHTHAVPGRRPERRSPHKQPTPAPAGVASSAQVAGTTAAAGRAHAPHRAHAAAVPALHVTRV
jgi:hypothetical protein